MNRYLWVALGLLALLAGSLAAIILLDVSNARVENGISLALKAVATCATVGGAAFGVLGRNKRDKDISEPANYPSTSNQHTDYAPTVERDQESSLTAYLSNMKTRLLKLGIDEGSFVTLTTVADASTDQAIRPELLPDLEWLSRHVNAEYAEPERIGLLNIPDRFDQTVLLGEPGSGKSTLLQWLALNELERAEARTKILAPDSSENENHTLRLPLFASLSDWQPGIKAVDFLRSQMRNLVGPENYYVNHFETLLADGHFIVLLDGLNELPGRKASSGEGRHEQSEEQTDKPQLPRIGTVSLDRRELELRELASSTGLHSKFVLTCRSHEYFDSRRWQVVRVMPMSPEQIDQFIHAYLPPERADDLRASLRNDENLSSIAKNPFFLRSIIRIYRPGMKLTSRGQILNSLYSILLENERDRLGGAFPKESTLTSTIGRLSFRMLAAGKIGNQATLGKLDENARTCTLILAGTGLIIERDGEFFFLHQIIQEFFAAMALDIGAIRHNYKTLLADKRWSEVVAIWCDLDIERMPTRVQSALRARNMPWRRPKPYPTPLLSSYQILTTFAVIAVASTYFLDWAMWPVHALSSPFKALGLAPVVLLAIALLIRVVWLALIRHKRIATNSAYVLSAIHYPAALGDIISALATLYERERSEVAQYVGRSFGLMALPHVRRGLEHRKWRVRAGCVQILGEIVRSHPEDQRALEILLSVARAGDPQLIAPLAEALGGCRDSRIPQAVGEILSGDKSAGFTTSYRLLSPLSKWDALSAIDWREDQILSFEKLASAESPSGIRAAALQFMGILRIPDCETRLAAVANNPREITQVREGAIKGLGRAQTEASVERLVELGERWQTLLKRVCTAIQGVRDPATMLALTRAARSSISAIRQAAATPLGFAGTSEALDLLAELSRDSSGNVREAAGRGLSLIGIPAAVPILGLLARDPYLEVRKTALGALSSEYPNLAGTELISLAEDVDYVDRVRAIRALGRYLQPEMEDRLLNLGGDLDKDVRNAAQAALRRIHAKARSLKRKDTRSRTGLFARAWQSLTVKLQIDGYREMMREERLTGVPDWLIFSKIQTRVQADAELARRYQLLNRVLMAGVNVMMFLGVFLLILILRLSLWGSAWLLQIWPYAAAFIALAGLSVLPGIRQASELRVVRPLVALLRLAAGAIIVVAVLGAITYVWWIVLLVAAAASLMIFFASIHKRRRRRLDVRSALRIVDKTAAKAT